MDVLIKSGRAVGRMDPDGTVWLAMEAEDAATGDDAAPCIASRVGRVDEAGCVFSRQESDGESAAEHRVGSVDATGLFWAEGGALRGAFEPSTGTVRDADRVVGHVFGPNANRAAAALCFLCPASDEVETGSQTGVPLSDPSPPKKVSHAAIAVRQREIREHEDSRRRRTGYLIAHLVVVALLIGGASWGGMALYAVASKYVRDARVQTRSAAASTTPSHPATKAPPHEVARPAVVPPDAVREALATRYSDIDRAFGSRDAEASVVPFAPEWVYVSTTGAVSDIKAARQYFAERSSGPKRFLSCSLETRIAALREGKNGTQVATVNQTVYTEVLRKDGGTRRVRTRIEQEDTWRDDGSFGWRCIRSRLRKQSATRL